MVGGEPASVLVEVDSIGGDFSALIKEICRNLQETYSVGPNKVVGTFRSVGMKEYAMNGDTLGK